MSGRGPARRRPALGLLLAAVFAAAVAASALPALAPAVATIFAAFDHAPESGPQALARMSGGEYAAAIEAIARRLPPDATYGLIDAVHLREGGGYWVRHDLAPRRAVYLGSLAEVAERPEGARELLARGLPLIVAHGSPGAPELWGADDLERWLAAPRAEPGAR